MIVVFYFVKKKQTKPFFMVKKIVGLFVLILTFSNSFADGSNHNPSQLGAHAKLKLADRYFAESLFYSAAENYRDHLAKKPNCRYASYWLAMSLYFAKDYEKAEKAFARFYALQPGKKDNKKNWEYDDRNEYKMGNLYYGMTLHRNAKYEEAKTALGKFRTDYHSNDPQEEANTILLAKRIAQACDSVQFLKKAKVKVNVLPKGINHCYSETAPFSPNEADLYYTSTGSDTLVTFSGYKNKLYTSIYKVSRSNQDWNKPKPVDEVINGGTYHNDRYNNGNGTFNRDGSRFYFTKCLERDDDRPLCNIFVSDVKKGKFSEPKRLPNNVNFEEKYTSTEPTVRATENKRVEYVYFSSNRPGGVGGMDLWYTKRTSDGEYEEPQLVKGNVNTVGDEISPFFSDSTQTLYFSSDAHPGFGGFDVFKTSQIPDGEKRIWTPIQNLGKPLNSGADDMFFSVSKDLTYGYFTSNRQGSIPLNGIATASDDVFGWENFNYGLEGTMKVVGNDVSQLDQKVPTRYNLYLKKEDGTKVLVGIDSSSKGGNYFFKLNPDADYEVEVNRDGFIPVSESITTKGLDDEDTLTKVFQVNKDAYVLHGNVAELGKPENKINGANILVYEILVGGEERLINELTVNANESHYYLKVPTGKDYKVMARKEGYFAGKTMASTKGLGNGIDSVTADVFLKKLELNKEYKLQNILYEFGKATLTKSSELVLDTLYMLMTENPTFVIELSSHTDSVGSGPGNMKLSQARAQSCVNYLIKKGIDKKRMLPMGYGKTKYVAPNSNPDGSDNPEGRALNRRTEFKILKM
jgi:outer membrane protein OmpA-like peptidoglycan-associated protein/tetratricopeptide (TPR) repeat protein